LSHSEPSGQAAAAVVQSAIARLVVARFPPSPVILAAHDVID
jgi:hypothetical protein